MLDIHKRKLSPKFECHSMNGLTIIAIKHQYTHILPNLGNKLKGSNTLKNIEKMPKNDLPDNKSSDIFEKYVCQINK